MVAAAIFFTLFLTMFNAFGIGKLFIRWKIAINNYLAITWGFLVYMFIHLIFFTILYLINANVLTYLIFIVAIQIMLIMCFIWNYQYFFITYRLNYKILLIFGLIALVTCAILILTILVGYKNGNNFFNVSNRNSQQFLALGNYLLFNKVGKLSIVKFYEGSFNFHLFSCLSIFSVCTKMLFNISGQNQIGQFLFWEYVPTYILIFSCAITGHHYLKIKHWSWVQICLFLITISIVSFGSFVFFASPTAGDSWLPLLLLVYINILFNLKYISDIARNVLLGLTVITLAAFDNNSILIETILTIFTFYYCMKNNLNPGGWLFWISGPYLTCFFMWIQYSGVWIYICLITITILMSVILIYILLLGGLNFIINRFDKIFTKHSLFFIVTLTSVIYVISLFLFLTAYDYQFQTSLWNYNYAWNFSLHSTWLNKVTWIIYALLMFMIIAQRLFAKKTEKKHLTNVSLIIFTLILFFNPLSLNIFVKLQTSNFSFDISLINWLIIVPLINTISCQIGKNYLSKPANILHYG